MVMPRSFSRSLESMTRSTTASLERKVPDWRSMASTSVVLPWSTWAMMAMLRRSIGLRFNPKRLIRNEGGSAAGFGSAFGGLGGQGGRDQFGQIGLGPRAHMGNDLGGADAAQTP